MRGKLGLIGALVVLGVVGLTGSARAGDPAGATYSRDPSAVFWFVQISDIHLGAGFMYEDRESLIWALSEGFDVIQPDFVVATGDLVNSRLFAQDDDEWEDYRAITTDLGMDPEFYFDLAGNHDQYDDADISHYMEYSVQGRATGQHQFSWTREFEFGTYHFLGLCTAGDDGAIAPADHAGLNGEELEFLLSDLEANTDANLTFAFGHHPVENFDDAGEAFPAILEEYGVSLYGHGHKHDLVSSRIGGVLHTRIDTLGKGSTGNVAIWAVDHDVVSLSAVDQESWPAVVVTTPADVSLGGENPYAPVVPGGVEDHPVRALAFAPGPVEGVRFRLEAGSWKEMTEVGDHLWQGDLDTRGVNQGRFTLVVEAVAGGETAQQEIRIEVGPSACNDGLDNDLDGYVDYPEDPHCTSPIDGDERGEDPVAEPQPDVVEPGADVVESVPDAGEPDAGEPDVTAPDVTEPDVTEPDAGAPGDDVGATPGPDTDDPKPDTGVAPPKLDATTGTDAAVPGPDAAADAGSVRAGAGGSDGGCAGGGAGSPGGALSLLLLLVGLWGAMRRAPRVS